MKTEVLKDFLDEKQDFYNNPAFIDSDPIQIPHRFAREEVTAVLRKLDPDDPVKYDYALFGLGIYEGF